MIYADNSSTTKISELALAEMLPFLQENYGNASSQYSHGVKSRRAVEKSRQQTAEAIGAKPSEIIFTSGGSEGNSWILQGVSALYGKEPVHIITTSIEHHSVINTCRELENRDVSVTYLPVDSDGYVSVDSVVSVIRPETKFVSIMLANNEIGTIQPIAAMGELLRNKGILFHTDAVQAVGHIPVSVEDLKVDFLTASAHKFYGANGTGFVYIREGVELPKSIFGGDQEHGRRAGTENVAGIVALGAALNESVAYMTREQERLAFLVQATIESVKAKIPHIHFNAENAERLPGLLNLTFPGVSGESMMHLLDLKGICVSTSSACNAGKDEASHVLLALGRSEKDAKSSIRVSYGRYNTEREVGCIVGAMVDAFVKITGIKGES